MYIGHQETTAQFKYRRGAEFRAGRLVGSLILVVSTLAAFSQPSFADEARYARYYGKDHGLPTDTVLDGKQAPDGTLFFGTRLGVASFDGVRFELLDTGVVDEVAVIVLSPGGELLFQTGLTLYFLDEAGKAHAHPIPVYGCAFDNTERLWCSRPDTKTVAWFDGTTWHDLDRTAFDRHQPTVLARHPEVGVVVGTMEGTLWQIESPTRVTPILGEVPQSVGRVDLVLPVDRDRLYFVRGTRPRKTLYSLVGGVLRELYEAENINGVSLRGQGLWVSINRTLVVIYPDLEPVLLFPTWKQFPLMRTFVDHEGGLWAMGYGGLIYLPEPDTQIWVRGRSEVQTGFHSLVKTDKAIVAGGWGATGFFSSTGRQRVQLPWPDQLSYQRLCSLDQQTVWILLETFMPEKDRGYRAPASIARFEPGSDAERRGPFGATGIFDCFPTGTGSAWFSFENDLYWLDRGEDEPSQVLTLDHRIVQLVEDELGVVWTWTHSGQICQSSARALSDGLAQPVCETLPKPAAELTLDPETGELLVVFKDGTVVKRDGDTWAFLFDLGRAASRQEHVRPSPRGGLWMAGVNPTRWAPTSPGGQWQLVEHLGQEIGLHSDLFEDVFEDGDGSLWLTGVAGTAFVPAHARTPPEVNARLKLSALIVDGEPRSFTDQIKLPTPTSTLQVHLAPRTYRSLDLIYEMTIDGTSLESNEPRFDVPRLSPGNHNLSFSVKLRDGANSGSIVDRAALALNVTAPHPWYQLPWVRALAVLLLVALAYGLYSMRLRRLLGLERQRQRIAQDLHDALGSSMASVGMLAETSLAGVTPSKQALKSIQHEAHLMSGSIRDLIWALDPNSNSLKGLWMHLCDRGFRLFGARGRTLETHTTVDLEEIPIELVRLRALQMIGLEALQNANKYSAPDATITLTLGQGTRGRFSLCLENRYQPELREAVVDRGGRGLDSLRRRANEINGHLQVRDDGERFFLRLDFDTM